ncbi:MAG: flagellar M-ring protein FliF C-terminal domain-containing protein [Planctomycetota bacterium]|jgi:flagellar M-ring protein FliF
MEALRQLLNRIQQQLGLMTRSQQMAIGLCAVIIMGSLLWLAQWSAKPQLEPLLDQPMTLQELNTAVESLKVRGAEFVERGDRIYVKPEERPKLLRELAAEGALPQDTSLGFENLLKDQSPFLPESINRRNFRIALQNELAAVIAAAADIASASVFINDFHQRGIGARTPVTPTASVDVTTARGEEMDQAGVQWVANLVSGGVAALEPHNVKVSVNGRPREVPGPEDLLSFGLLEEKKKNEKHYEEKIHDLLSYIPGVKVAVSVELETTRKLIEERTFDEPQPKREKTSEQNTNSGSSAAEPGVNPNTGTALTEGTGQQSSSTEEDERENFPPQLVRTETSEQIPLREKAVTASINIPRSYFASVYRAQHPAGNEPNDADLKVLIDIEQKRVRAGVRNLIGAAENDAVQVDWFPDLTPGSPGSFADSPFLAAGEARADLGTVATLTDYAPQAGLVGLAIAALLMMVMMVRKSARAAGALLPDTPQQEEPEEPPPPLSHAELSEGFLVGQEVDEDTLRVKNLGEQVSRMVEENPETAADLIRRWVERD